MALLAASPSIICLQETKLVVSFFKASTFLPPCCRSFLFFPSDSASGGLLIAWNNSDWDCSLLAKNDFSLTCSFLSRVSDVSFCLSNIYGPCDSPTKPAFLSELLSLAHIANGPWALIGDFNQTIWPSDRSNSHFNAAEASRFAAAISSLEFLEVPLLGRSFTWTNQQSSPILVRLDRAFVDLQWSSLFPNSTLSFLPRSTSDHVPIVLSVSFDVP
ncbi:hypothetical protein BRADI_2g36875v3, partial [Brachypodium distachyon]